VLIVAIGVSRIMLGVHYLSDVVGSWCLGVAWLGLTAYAFELWRHGAGERLTAALEEGLEPESAKELKPTEGWRPSPGSLSWAGPRRSPWWRGCWSSARSPESAN
jgi:PAP2 superfamily